MSGLSGSAGGRRAAAGRPGTQLSDPDIIPDATREHVVTALHGAALDLSAGPDDVRIALLDRQGETAMLLGPFDEEDAVARWRSLSMSSGLVPMLRVSTGEVEVLAAQIGRLRVGRQSHRRPHAFGRRRPRFLARRKTARLPALPLVYREPEIAAGASA